MGIVTKTYIATNQILGKFNLKLIREFPRPMTKFIMLSGKKDLIGAEIGVYKGEHAVSLLKNLTIERLYLIDPYSDYPGYKDAKRHYGKDQDPLDIAEQQMKDATEKWKFKISYIKLPSWDVKKENLEMFDFIYID